jgi:hypothetical protein
MTATNFNSNLGSPFNKIEEIGTDVSYEFRKLSTSVSNVIKIVSNENYYNNARSAYDPYSYSGFVDNYELTTAPYIIKQADVTGKVVFTGLLLRYVPSDNKQTIFIKSLDGFFDYDNNVVFSNHKDKNAKITVPFSQTFSFGSSIDTITDLYNVMKITVTYKTDKSYFTGPSTPPYHYDYGNLLKNIIIRNGSNADLTTNPVVATGKILATISATSNSDGSISESYIVSLSNNLLTADYTNTSGGLNYVAEWNRKNYWYIEESLEGGILTNPCGRFAIDTVLWINADANSTIYIQEIVFNDSVCSTGINYVPVLTGGSEDLVQYNYMSSSIVDGSEYLSKIRGETLSWDKSLKTLVAITTVKFQKEFGKIYYFGDTGCGDGLGGTAIDQNMSNINLSSGFFANISSPYELSGKDYSVGNTAIQNITESSSWSDSINYSVGDIVTQYNKDLTSPLNSDPGATFEVINFSKAKTFGQSLNQPTVLTFKSLNNTKLNITNLIGTDTALLKIGNPEGYTPSNFPYLINRVVAIGNKSLFYVNTSQIKYNIESEQLTKTSSQFFSSGVVYLPDASPKIGTCLITKVNHIADDKFKIYLSDINPVGNYTMDTILKNCYSFSYKNNNLFQVIPESTKYNKLILTNSPHIFNKGDVIVHISGAKALIIDSILSNPDVNTTKQALIIQRLNANDVIFNKDTKITSYYDTSILFSLPQPQNITSCDAYGEIYIDNLIKDGFIYELDGGFIFSNIEPGQLLVRKTISGSWGGGTSVQLSTDQTGGARIQSGYELVYKTGTDINRETSGNDYVTKTSSNPPVITIRKPSGASDNFIFSADYAIDISNYRIKDLEINSETRTLKHIPGSAATENLGETYDTNIYFYLTKSDVYKIDQILYTNTNDDTVVSDVTKYFILDTGERKDIYGFSKISFNYDYTKEMCSVLGISSANTSTDNLNQKITEGETVITIIYSYFEHRKSDGIIGPVVKNSYRYGTKSQIPNEEIGYSVVGKNNKKLHKSAIIDFRPIYSIKSGETIGSNENPYDDSTKIEVSFSLLPSDSFIVTGKHYLPRRDSLYLTKDGVFKIEEGIPGINPSIPTKEIPDAMKLYDIFIPGYTLDVSDIKTTAIENKRYTMRDIGKLEKRIKNVEYYTQLSLVEKKAADLIVTDSNGLDRSKNGIIVDNYETYLISDTSNRDYNGCIDIRENILRHSFMTSRFGFKFNESDNFSEVKYDTYTTGEESIDIRKILETGSSEKLNTGLYMLNTTSRNKPFIVQPAASSAVSLVPLDGIKSLGHVTIDPAVDDWIDIKQLPDLRVDLLKGFDEVLNNITDTLINNNQGVWGTRFGEWSSGSEIRRGRDVFSEQSRDVSKTGLDIQHENISLGERVTDVSLAHYIRPQDLYLYVTGLKPNTKLYVFLDDVNVDELCSVVTEQNTVGTPFKTLNYIPKTNSSGNVIIKFTIKTGAYRTGDRTFNITDSSTNDKFSVKTTMYASAVFSASGLALTKQETIAEGRKFETKTTVVSEKRDVLIRTDPPPAPPRRSRDPIAQTFSINKDLYPSGVYVSSFDFCFASKDATEPVMAQLRPTVNGYPDSKNVHPHGVSIVPASKVIALSETEIALLPDIRNNQRYTRFNFDPPVYLEPGEHSIVLHSQSTQYSVYAATIGEDDISVPSPNYIGTSTNRKIISQPYVGEFFRSSNASTWAPDGTTDLMFSANLCTFMEGASLTTPKTASINFIINTEPSQETGYAESFGMFEENTEELTYELINFKNYIMDVKDTATITNLVLISKDDSLPYPNVTFDTDIVLSKSMILDKTQTPSTNNNTIKISFESVIYNPYVSPVIDIQKSGIILVRNLIDTNEVDVNGTITSEIIKNEKLPKAVVKPSTLLLKRPATSRYISKMVTLADGFDAVNCKVILTINKPAGTAVAVFVRTEAVGSNGNFNELPYREMVYNGLPFNSKNGEFNEMEFTLPEDIGSFDKFAFKICLFSNNGAVVPKINDFIGIAIS